MTEELWQQLRLHATPRGLALVREPRLVAELGATHEGIQAALTALQLEHRITVLTPLPYLVVKLLSWSGSTFSQPQETQQISSDSGRVHREVPVSSSIAAAAIQQRVVGGAGEGGTLLDEVVATLGTEADRDEFARIIAGKSPALVRRCLQRVRATRFIRVSRTALFRSLLMKLSH